MPCIFFNEYKAFYNWWQCWARDLWSQCAVGQLCSQNLSGTRKITAITVVALTTTVIVHFLSSPPNMGYAYFHWAKLDQCMYAIKIIHGVQLWASYHFLWLGLNLISIPHCCFLLSMQICLVNDPRPQNKFDKLYTVQYLGNMVEGRKTQYNNQPVEVLKKLAAASIKEGEVSSIHVT